MIIIFWLGSLTNRIPLGGSTVVLLFRPSWIPCTKVVSQNIFKVLYVWDRYVHHKDRIFGDSGRNSTCNKFSRRMEEDFYHFLGGQTLTQSPSVAGNHWVVVQVISSNSLIVFTASLESFNWCVSTFLFTFSATFLWKTVKEFHRFLKRHSGRAKFSNVSCKVWWSLTDIVLK